MWHLIGTRILWWRWGSEKQRIHYYGEYGEAILIGTRFGPTHRTDNDKHMTFATVEVNPKRDPFIAYTALLLSIIGSWLGAASLCVSLMFPYVVPRDVAGIHEVSFAGCFW